MLSIESLSMIGEALKGHLDLLLLAVLESGPAHGYVIIAALRERSQGTFDLPEGTVYPALHRLEEDGLLSSQWSESGGRRRRVYQLTSKGLLELAKRQEEWNRFAQAVNSTVGI
jgi:PadR family transcriptional regulator, regulatory protein PadR